MGRIRALSTILALGSLLSPMTAPPASANRIPGIPIMIKCPCPGPVYVESQRCCTKKATTLVVGGLVPGSAPVETSVLLQGRCAYSCNPGDPGDDRIDYDTNGDAGPFTMTLPSMTLYSSTPIQVDVSGVMTPFDVVVTLSGPAPQADDPMQGEFSLPSGSSLSLGASAQVASSTLDLHATTTFFNALTGVQANAVIEQDFHLNLFTFTPDALPVTRVADGSTEGGIVMGFGGSSPDVFGYASSDGDLVLNLQSLYDAGAVPVKPATWGALKAIYR
jgi:hypothetical protein